MTNQLFDEIICFTDIHFGKKGNSRIHNDDCENFVKWFCDLAKSRNIKVGAFLGDWHDQRHTLNISTLNYTISNLRRLNDTFDKFFIITGNHDLYYREKREISSLVMGKEFPNLVLVDEPYIEGDVAFMPWLVNDEWQKVSKIKTKYMFGHFEIPGFKMNAMVEMPDHGGMNSEQFKHQDLVFSGHFHKRQNSGKVHYMGNPFGHNFSDAWDFDRGCMLLKWGGEPEYINWPDGPKYVTAPLSKIVEEPESYLLPNSYVKATIDIDMTYEEVNYLKEVLVEQYPIREFKMTQDKSTEHEGDEDLDTNFETVDEIVIEQLSNIESDSYDKNVLLSIYNNL